MHVDPTTGQLVPDPGDPPIPTAPGVSSTPTTAVTSSTGTSRGALAPAAAARVAAARAALVQNEQAQIEAAQKDGELKAQRAKLEEQQADQEAAVRAQHAQLRQEANAAGEREFAGAKARHTEEWNRYRQMDIRDYWADKSTGHKVLAGIAVFLGGLGAGRNQAAEILQSNIARDFERQRERIERQYQAVQAAGRDVGSAGEQLAARMKSLDLKESAALATVAAKMKAELARLGVPQAQVAANKEILAIEAKAAEKRTQVDESERTRISSNVSRGVSQGGSAGADGLIFGPEGKVVANVGDKKKAEAINKFNAQYLVGRELLEKLRESYAKGFSFPVFGEEAQKRENLLSRAKTAHKNMQELGALAGPDAGLLETQFGGTLQQLTGSGGDVKIGESLKDLDSGHVKFLSSYGLPGSRVSADVRGEKAAPSSGAGAQRQPARARLPSADRARLIKHLREHPDDPRAPQIRAALGM